MNLKLTVLLASSFCLLLACDKQAEDSKATKPLEKDEHTLSEETVKASDKPELNNKVNLKNKKFIADKELVDKKTKKTLLINGEKFIVHGTVLEKGTKVFSPSIQQVGIVNGSIVIVTSTFDANQLTAAYKLSSITEIAKNTFRLTPDDSADLYRFYQSLTNSTEIEQVELSIDYSRYPPKSES
jgi:hypothetical protein